jgi:hypothetical protein
MTCCISLVSAAESKSGLDSKSTVFEGVTGSSALNCACQAYNCECRKECVCKIIERDGTAAEKFIEEDVQITKQEVEHEQDTEAKQCFSQCKADHMKRIDEAKFLETASKISAQESSTKVDIPQELQEKEALSFMETNVSAESQAKAKATLEQAAKLHARQTGTASAKEVSVAEILGAPPAWKEPVLFKCGCDFGGADVAMQQSQGLDCDCNVAKCSCKKQCTCGEA